MSRAAIPRPDGAAGVASGAEWERAQSFSFKKDGLEYHLRGRVENGPGYDAILVKDKYHWGKQVAILRTRVDVIRFVDARVAES
jgi:hypothetical protein